MAASKEASPAHAWAEAGTDADGLPCARLTAVRPVSNVVGAVLFPGRVAREVGAPSRTHRC
jgi:hypothetical protein